MSERPYLHEEMDVCAKKISDLWKEVAKMVENAKVLNDELERLRGRAVDLQSAYDLKRMNFERARSDKGVKLQQAASDSLEASKEPQRGG